MPTIARRDFPTLLRPGIVIWRPVYRGKPSDIKLQGPSGDCDSPYVYTLPFSITQRAFEPMVNWFDGTEGQQCGMITFLQDFSEQPLKELPPNWFALEIFRLGRSRRSVFATPLTVEDMRDYLDFRHELAGCYQSPEKSKAVAMYDRTELRRLHIAPTFDAEGRIDVNCNYTYL